MECKRALEETSGSLEEAIKILRAQGGAIAQAKAGRTASEGLIATYTHGGRIGVLLELNCETDFVARTDQFKELAHNICLQIASMDPIYVSQEQVPAKDAKLMKERVLLNQPFVKDPSKTIQDLLHDAVSSIRENIVIRRFVRFVLGEEVQENRSTS